MAPIFNSPPPSPIASSSNPNLPPPSCFHGTQRAANDLPPAHSTEVKIGQRKGKRQKASTSISPLATGKKLKNGKGSTLDTATPPPLCSECGRQFLTAKALHGHMRSHPERKWRGMNPRPVQVPINPATSEFTEKEVNAASSLILLLSGGHDECMRNVNDGFDKGIWEIPNEARKQRSKRKTRNDASTSTVTSDSHTNPIQYLDLELRLGVNGDISDVTGTHCGDVCRSQTGNMLPERKIESEHAVDLELRLGF